MEEPPVKGSRTIDSRTMTHEVQKARSKTYTAPRRQPTCFAECGTPKFRECAQLECGIVVLATWLQIIMLSRARVFASRSEDKLNVHLVCHSHHDPGWLKTYDQGFLGTRNDYHVRPLHTPDCTAVQTALHWRVDCGLSM